MFQHNDTAAELRLLTDSSLIMLCHSYQEQVPLEKGGKEWTLIQQEHVKQEQD